jgi:hypothetical protein
MESIKTLVPKFLLFIFILLAGSSLATANTTFSEAVVHKKGLGLTDTFSTIQQDTLPFPPETVYDKASPQSEQLLNGEQVPENLTVQEWRADLDTLASKIRSRIPYYEAAMGEQELKSRVDSLKKLVPQQTRDQRILSIMHLTNLPAVGTGHTTTRPTQRVLGWRSVPVFPYRFADGVYIMSAINPDWIGSEILAINGTPIDSVNTALSRYVSSDNRWDIQNAVLESYGNYRWANNLKALGIVDDIYEIPLRIRTPQGQIKQIRVQTLLPNTAKWVSTVLTPPTSPKVPENMQWSPGTGPQFNPEPNYRLSYRDSTDVLYLDFNIVEKISEEWTIGHLADSLRTIADKNPISKMIVDIRTNGGGNSSEAEPLLELFASHPKFNQRGKLYTLIGPQATSAGGIFAMQMERRTKTIFAGEETSFPPNIWGEIMPYKLPNSNIVVLLSHTYHQEGMPDTPRTHLAPDIHVPMTSDQHFQNVDSTMIAVKKHEPKPRFTITLNKDFQQKFIGTYRISPIHRAIITQKYGRLHLRVDRGARYPFIDTDLYPISTTRLATDISDVYVDYRLSSGQLNLAWKDTTYTLKPADSDFTLPSEHIRSGQLDEAETALKHAIASGIKIGSDFIEHPLTDMVEEQPLPIWPEDLTRKEKARRALPYAKLADELAPVSWYSTAELAWLYMILGQEDKMINAALRTVQQNPVDGANFIREYVGLEVTPNGGIIKN